MAPNLVQWDKVLLYCSDGGLWRPLGAMLGHFGTFQSDFGPQSKRLGPVWSLFLTSLATQKDLNGPKSGTVRQDLNILYWWRPFGAFWGPSQVILE